MYWLNEVGIDFNKENEISKEEFNYIKEYFINYERTKIDLNKVKDISKLFSKFFHECEARYDLNNDEDYEKLKVLEEEFIKEVESTYLNGSSKVIDSKVLLDKFFNKLELKDSQKEFISHRFFLDKRDFTSEITYYLESVTHTLFAYNNKTKDFKMYIEGE